MSSKKPLITFANNEILTNREKSVLENPGYQASRNKHTYRPTDLDYRVNLMRSRKPFSFADRAKKPNGTKNLSPLITPITKGSSLSLPAKTNSQPIDYPRIYADISRNAEPSDMEGLINALTNLNPAQKNILRTRLHHNFTPNNLKKTRKNKRSTRKTRSRRTRVY